MRKGNNLENDKTRMITKAQTKVDHAPAEHAKADGHQNSKWQRLPRLEMMQNVH